MLDERISGDCLAYIEERIACSRHLAQAIGAVEQSGGDSQRLKLRLVELAHGNLLYLRLTLDLLEGQVLRVRSTSFASLPQNLAEVRCIVY